MKNEFAPNIITATIVFFLKLFLAISSCFRKRRTAKEAGAYTTETPVIGDTITAGHALDLCRKYGFDTLVDRLTSHPEDCKDWQFDGVSMLPECLAQWLTGSRNITEIALRHDLKYAYGEPGNSTEKRVADLELEQEIIADGGHKWVAGLLLCAVVVFGREEYGFDFSWCFALKEKKLTE